VRSKYLVNVWECHNCGKHVRRNGVCADCGEPVQSRSSVRTHGVNVKDNYIPPEDDSYGMQSGKVKPKMPNHKNLHLYGRDGNFKNTIAKQNRSNKHG